MNRTKIPWCDWTWNPIVGCSPASAGCANCYADAISKRFHLPWGSAHFLPGRLDQPEKVRKPGRVFVCSMADIFHPSVDTGAIVAILDVIRYSQQHTFIVLTKRPERLLEEQLCLPGDDTDPLGQWFDMPNIWLGVTVENQEQAEKRIPILLRTPPRIVRFVSVEPMLEAVTLRRVRFPTGCVEDVFNTEVSERARPIVGKLNGIDWVIAGPETGPKARPCDDAWIDALAAESPCFFDKRDKWTRREFPRGVTR